MADGRWQMADGRTVGRRGGGDIKFEVRRRGSGEAGKLEGWKAGRLGSWEAGRLEGGEAGRPGSWEAGKLEGWKIKFEVRRRGEIKR